MRWGLATWVAAGVVLGTTLASWLFNALDLVSTLVIAGVACAGGLLLAAVLRYKRAS